MAFAAALPAIRSRVAKDIETPGHSRAKVLGTVVQLLERTGIRVGNDEYTRANQSFGLTTLRDRHVEVSGSTLRFEFRGKGGKTHTVDVTDRRLARIVQDCRDIPGQDLFQYIDDEGARQAITSGDVNEYLREVAGEDFTAKDFRTWVGTVAAAVALRELAPSASEREAKARINEAVDRVAEQLNNTRAICRKYYVHPAVLGAYLEGEVIGTGETRSATRSSRGLRPDEAAVAALLRRRVAPERKAG